MGRHHIRRIYRKQDLVENSASKPVPDNEDVGTVPENQLALENLAGVHIIQEYLSLLLSYGAAYVIGTKDKASSGRRTDTDEV